MLQSFSVAILPTILRRSLLAPPHISPEPFGDCESARPTIDQPFVKPAIAHASARDARRSDVVARSKCLDFRNELLVHHSNLIGTFVPIAQGTIVALPDQLIGSIVST